MITQKKDLEMKIDWLTKKVKIIELTPYEKNPRRITKDAFEKLKKSIQEDGYHGRILATKDFKVIGGHQRIKALKELGFSEVEVLIPSRELTEEEYRRILIRDNLQAGEWDFEELANSFDAQELLDWGFPENLLPSQEGVINEPAGDDDEAPEAPAIPKTVRGDVYTIGNHRLMCGDSTLIDDVDKLMDGAKADMVFTDPPYVIGIDGQKQSVNANPKHNRKAHEFRGWDSERPDRELFDYIVALKCPAVIYGGNYFADFLPATRGWIYWSKGQDGLTMSDGELAWTNMDKPLRSVTVNRAALGKTVHPTQKPIPVVEHGLQYVGECKAVLDLFGGSGSTMVAAHKLGRTAYLMELDEKYCDVIVNRMHKLFPDLAITRNGEPFAVEGAVRGQA
jgi:DNA modification methylase